jgi:RNA polymerase sigma-70 factor, ECF subfamily
MEPAATPAAVIENPGAALREFDEVVRLHWPRIYRFALASLRDPDAAQTLAQDCFFKAFRARAGFRGESSVRTWLMQIAANLVRDAARNRRLLFWKRSQDSTEAVAAWLPDRGLSAEQTAALKQRVQGVWEAAAHLPERQRTVFLLRFVEEMEILEIAAATGMKEGTVKAHLFRALETIRKRLGDSE